MESASSATIVRHNIDRLLRQVSPAAARGFPKPTGLVSEDRLIQGSGIEDIHASSLRPLNSVPRWRPQTPRRTLLLVCCREYAHTPMAHRAASGLACDSPLDSRFRDGPEKIVVRTCSSDGICIDAQQRA